MTDPETVSSLPLDALLRETEKADHLLALAADIEVNEWTIYWRQDVALLRAVAALLPELARRLKESSEAVPPAGDGFLAEVAEVIAEVRVADSASTYDVFVETAAGQRNLTGQLRDVARLLSLLARRLRAGEAENGSLRRELDRRASGLSLLTEQLRDRVEELESELSLLRADSVRLAKDAERLDWLEQEIPPIL